VEAKSRSARSAGVAESRVMPTSIARAVPAQEPKGNARLSATHDAGVVLRTRLRGSTPEQTTRPARELEEVLGVGGVAQGSVLAHCGYCGAWSHDRAPTKVFLRRHVHALFQTLAQAIDARCAARVDAMRSAHGRFRSDRRAPKTQNSEQPAPESSSAARALRGVAAQREMGPPCAGCPARRPTGGVARRGDFRRTAVPRRRRRCRGNVSTAPARSVTVWLPAAWLVPRQVPGCAAQGSCSLAP
jgi:hypothetical protein